MKRYSVSIAYNRNREENKPIYHYYGRTDNVEETIASYKKGLESWISRITDENYKYRSVTDDYYGIKITDSQTKKTVYEDYHFAEEYGWKREVTIETYNNRNYYKIGDWVKI